MDDFLKTQCNERVFAQRFEGVYSIQRICQDCPHRCAVNINFYYYNAASRTWPEGFFKLCLIKHKCQLLLSDIVLTMPFYNRYEREEPFLALNLTVTKCHDLQDSLDQFVKGELLEGDNAYYCEKCNLKVWIANIPLYTPVAFILLLLLLWEV